MKKKTKGYILIGSPFAVIACMGIGFIGVLPTISIFAITTIIYYVIATGVELIED